MILEDFQWHTWPCPITVSKQFNLYKGRQATSDTGSHSRLTPKLPPLLRLRFVPNPNYVASNPGGIPKSQISLRSTPTTTGGADNLTLLSFISWCGQTGTNYSGAPFSPLPSLPVAQPTLAPATNNITRKYSFSLKMIFLVLGADCFVLLLRWRKVFASTAKWSMSASLPALLQSQYFISQNSLSSALLHHGFKSLRNPPSRWNSVLWPKYRMELAHLKVRASR